MPSICSASNTQVATAVRATNERINRDNVVEDVLERVAYDCFDTNPQTRDRELAPQQPGELPPYYVLNDANDTTLVFESRFECGNLRRAIQIYEFEYDLVLHPDVNTNLKSHVQWFYFRVNNMRPGNRYRGASPDLNPSGLTACLTTDTSSTSSTT